MVESVVTILVSDTFLASALPPSPVLVVNLEQNQMFATTILANTDQLVSPTRVRMGSSVPALLVSLEIVAKATSTNAK
jgi:hypothetical protein